MPASAANLSTVPTLVRALVGAALLLCLCVVVLGAYVRLSSAGLGCPDWPGCYGHLTSLRRGGRCRAFCRSPMAGRPLEVGKAWREMIHRYAAGTLGLLILSLVVIGTFGRRERVLPARYVTSLFAIVLAQASARDADRHLAAQAARGHPASAVWFHHAVAAAVAGAVVVAALVRGRRPAPTDAVATRPQTAAPAPAPTVRRHGQGCWQPSV